MYYDHMDSTTDAFQVNSTSPIPGPSRRRDYQIEGGKPDSGPVDHRSVAHILPVPQFYRCAEHHTLFLSSQMSHLLTSHILKKGCCSFRNGIPYV